MKDKIDILYQRKKFFKIIFPKLNKEEYIRLFQKKDDKSKVTFWHDVDDMNNYIERYKFNTNTYYSLATTNGQGGSTTDIIHRYCIGLDFDKKLDNSLDSKEIMFRFKKIGLWYHCLIDSGNGYHVYICIQETNDIGKVVQVTKTLGKILGSDCQAELSTQILRVPLTYNLKNDKHKQVNIIYMFEKNTIKPYDINNLYDKFCTNINKKDRTIQYEMENTKMPPCIIKILDGVDKGTRHFYMKRLISFFKLYGKNKSEIYNLIKEWNDKCNPPTIKDTLTYQFNNLWKGDYKCFGCIYKEDINIQNLINKYCNKEKCKNRGKNNHYGRKNTLIIEYKICKKLEKIRRKSSVKLNGNELFLIGILKNNPEGLKTNELINKISYNNICCLSKPTINKTLNSLCKKKFIIIIKGIRKKGEKNFYKIKTINCDRINEIHISYLAFVGVIAKLISISDLLVYIYMIYRLNQNLNVIETELASLLGMSHQALSKHIKNLISAKYIEFKGKNYTTNKYGYNEYVMNM